MTSSLATSATSIVSSANGFPCSVITKVQSIGSLHHVGKRTFRLLSLNVYGYYFLGVPLLATDAGESWVSFLAETGGVFGRSSGCPTPPAVAAGRRVVGSRGSSTGGCVE